MDKAGGNCDCKNDKDTGNHLAGAIYGVYRDKECSDLITQMPATDSKGGSKVTIEKIQDVVYVKEIQPPANYQADPTVYPVDVNIGKTSTKNVLNERTYAKIHLIKEDAQTGANPQGDATLEGAVYGLYARENIVHPDGTTGIVHKAGDLVSTLKVDQKGDAVVKDLYLGKYFVKEIQAPEGYLLDETEHDVECSYEGGTVPTIERTVKSTELVMKQPFQIIKAANNGETDAELLKGAGFSAYLKSSLEKKKMEVMISPMQSQSSLQQMVKRKCSQMRKGMRAVFRFHTERILYEKQPHLIIINR